ncbi:MAG: hypothetical protein RRB13_00665 [bacterium]|nr:hypothetical protein [bacterium]
MNILMPFYCPNCKGLVFLLKGGAPLLLDRAHGDWAQHPCRRAQGKPLMDFDIVQQLVALPVGEGFAFKFRPGGHHRHEEPTGGVVLRLPDKFRPNFQLITGENGLFEVRLNGAEALKQGSLIELKGLKRTGPDRFRCESWSPAELAPREELMQERPQEIYRLILKAAEQEALESHCGRFLNYFERKGEPVLGLLVLPVEGDDEPVYGRQILLSPEANVLGALERVALPAQVSYRIDQIRPEQLHDR